MKRLAFAVSLLSVLMFVGAPMAAGTTAAKPHCVTACCVDGCTCCEGGACTCDEGACACCASDKKCEKKCEKKCATGCAHTQQEKK